RRIPSIHHLREQRIRAVLDQVVRQVDESRRIFVTRLREGEIRHCGCAQPDCPTYMLTHRVVDELDEARRKILTTFRTFNASFKVSQRWRIGPRNQSRPQTRWRS